MMAKYYEKKSKWKRFFKTTSITIVILILFVFLYNMYINVDVKEEQEVESKKFLETVEAAEEKSKSISEMIQGVSDGVVGISKIKEKGTSIFLNNANDKLGLGTGMIVSENGYILTNQHVAGKKYSKCYVTLDNGREYAANVVWADEDIDLAIIKINANGLTCVQLGDSDNILIGENVYAIGNPIGFEFQKTVTSGIVSALNRTIKIEEDNKISYLSDLIQTDATINPGNSGGPLITNDGRVIGVTSVKITSAEGIGFAIPINLVKPIIQIVTQEGEFEEASIGMFAYDKAVIPYLESNLNFDNGIYVAQINLDGAAAKSGLKEGDISTKIEEITLEKMSQLREYLYTKKPNDEVTLQVLSKNKMREIKIKLGRK